MTLTSILSEKGSRVHSVRPDVMVREAVAVMNEHRIGAVLVVSDGHPVGMFSERDVLQRVVAANRDPGSTPVSDVMTKELISVGPDTALEEAMAVVSDRRCRHLPVMDGDVLLGMVSAGDLVQRVTRGQKFEIAQLVNYVTQKYPA